MRKSSFSGSGRPSMSGAPLRVRNGNINTNNAGPSKRTSAGKGENSSRARSSVGSHMAHNRMSFIPKTGRPSSGIGVRGRTDTPKDPRPITDKKYQSQCIKQLLEFLMSNNYPHAISHKLLISPTSKDFFKIFEFVYGKLSPGYKMVAKMEEEVPRVLKMLGYPFTLAKSHLFSVGSPLTWPHLCASLCWMIDLVQFADNIHQEGIDKFIFESAADTDFDGVSEEKIVFDYCESTYHAFMSGLDDFSEQDEAVERLLKRQYHGGNLDNLVDECKRLEAQLTLIEEAEERSDKLKEKTAEMRQDQQVTEAYIKDLEQYKRSVNNELKEREEDCKALEIQLEAEKARIAEMQIIYQQQDLTPSDVERLKAEQNGLRAQVDQLEKQVEDIDSDNWKINMEITAITDKVEKEVATYNRLALALKLIPETAELAKGKDYRLKAGFNSNIVGHFEENIKPMLKTLKNKYHEDLRRKNKEKFQIQLELEQFQESVAERRERVAQKERELASTEAELESMKQLLVSDKKSVNEELETVQQTVAQTEALLHDLIQAKNSAQSEYQEAMRLAEMRKQAIEKELLDLEKSRAEKTEQIIKHKETFKQQIQAYLEELQSANSLMESRLQQAENVLTQSRKDTAK